ncbi:hypothetical protein SD70_05220 [Gordoniibacillus kamchatkensis]|uniref:Uncharacterized protein n=1 Tax=Gordoniibacillus kamchatkensis TaxID=1590651 RepID=A0ABR5ALD6_9BACL|nr:DUF5665 domain-containing protein [Paenibacillus sp. VKM B-2647]KIL41799.1 hypothetical protein SD70_05220 [Paenibacillus sp. VKM B-2647]
MARTADDTAASAAEQRKLVATLRERVEQIAQTMEKSQIADYVQLMHKPRRLIWLNLVAGISRGVGIAIGFTIFTSSIVYLLRMLGALDLPIIGGYIAEVVKHVQMQLEHDGYVY